MATTLGRLRELAGIVESRPAYSGALTEDTAPEYLSEQRILDEGFEPEESEFLAGIGTLSEEALDCEIEWLREGLNRSKKLSAEHPQGLPHGEHRVRALKHAKDAKTSRERKGYRGHAPETMGSHVANQEKQFRFHAMAAHQHHHAAKHLQKELDGLKDVPKHLRLLLKKKERIPAAHRAELAAKHPGAEHLHRLWRRHSMAADLNQTKAGHYKIHPKGGYWMTLTKPKALIHKIAEPTPAAPAAPAVKPKTA